jgi:TM2 domain-containing membrane protein YozV
MTGNPNDGSSPPGWPQPGAPAAPQWQAPPPPPEWQSAPQQPPQQWQQPGQPAPQWQPPGQPPQQWQQPGAPPQQWQGGPPAGGASSDIVQPTNMTPGVAAVLSFFFPGVGQILLGQQIKGAVLLGISLFTGAMCGILCIVAAIDAFQIGKKHQAGIPVRQWDFF